MNLKTLLLASALVAGSATVPVAASAFEYEVTRNIGITSDYVWRGVSQSDSEESLFGGVDLTSGMFYAGVWAGQVDFGGDANAEVDFYAGVKPSLGPVTLDLGVLYYAYPQETNINVVEVKAAAGVDLGGGFSLTGSTFYSPEVGDGGPSSFYGEIAAGYDIPANLGPFDLSLAASIGNFSYEDTLEDYSNYRIAVSGATENGWTLVGAYTDTDVENVDAADGRFSVTLTKGF
jgi:uncharacterized protein (TIGR02001 family)